MNWSNFASGAQGIGTLLSQLTQSGGIQSILGGLFGSKSSERRAMRNQQNLMRFQSELEKEMMSYQNDLNVANWNMENEYNSPKAQYQRYTDAGLNPNLIYGGSGSVSGNAGSVSGVGLGAVGTGHSDANDALMFQKQMSANLASQMADTSLKMAQVRNLDAQTNEVSPNAMAQREYLKSQVGLNNQQCDLVEQQTSQTKYYLNWLNSTDETRKLGLKLDNWLKESQIDLNEESASNYKALCAMTMYNLKNVLPWQSSQAEFEAIFMNPERLKNLISDTDLKKANSKEAYAKAVEAYAQAAYYESVKYSMDTETAFKRSYMYGSKFWISNWQKQFQQDTEHLAVEILNGRQNYQFMQWKTHNEKHGYPYRHSGLFGTGLSIYGFNDLWRSTKGLFNLDI